jgi:tetratricopeptide (TPR) repeat protein
MRAVIGAFCLLSFAMTAGFASVEAEDLTDCLAGWRATQEGNHALAATLTANCITKGDLSQPTKARAFRNLGIASNRDGKFEKAITAYDKAIALQPADIWNDYVNRGNSYSNLEQFDQALADYDRALAARPNFHEAFYNRGIVFERQDKLNLARAEFLKAFAEGLRTDLLKERLIVYGDFDRLKQSW